jgi:hypothetical protein
MELILPKRSYNGPHEDDRAIAEALALVAGCDITMLAARRNKLLGVVMGRRDNTSTFVPWHRCGANTLYDSYDMALKANTADKQFCRPFFKRSTMTSGCWFDQWSADGDPAAGAYGGTARTAKQFTQASLGAMRIGPAMSPRTKYLRRYSRMTYNRNGASFLYDRVLTYETCTMSNGNQTMTNTLTAQRFAANGDRGLQIMITGDAVHNATATNMSQLRYTNQAGTTLQSVPTTPTLSVITSLPAPVATAGARGLFQQPGASTRNELPFLRLAAGDLGAQLINDYSFTAAPTGTNCFALIFPYVLQVGHAVQLASSDEEFVMGIEALGNLQVYDTACMSSMAIFQTVTTSNDFGWSEIAWT